MNNGSNDWGVNFSHIMWLNDYLKVHRNILDVSRSHDILFTVHRKRQSDVLRILCCNEYAMSFTLVLRGLNEFGELDIFYVGGGWNGYTEQAKSYCIENRIGLFVTDEMTGALWADEWWTYYRKDEKGNTICFYRAA
jgi:hypothetical protein